MKLQRPSQERKGKIKAGEVLSSMDLGVGSELLNLSRVEAQRKLQEARKKMEDHPGSGTFQMEYLMTLCVLSVLRPEIKSSIRESESLLNERVESVSTNGHEMGWLVFLDPQLRSKARQRYSEQELIDQSAVFSLLALYPEDRSEWKERLQKKGDLERFFTTEYKVPSISIRIASELALAFPEQKSAIQKALVAYFGSVESIKERLRRFRFSDILEAEFYLEIIFGESILVNEQGEFELNQRPLATNKPLPERPLN